MARTAILLSILLALSVLAASARDISQPPSTAPAPAPAHHRKGHHPHGGHHRKPQNEGPVLASAQDISQPPSTAPAPAPAHHRKGHHPHGGHHRKPQDEGQGQGSINDAINQAAGIPGLAGFIASVTGSSPAAAPSLSPANSPMPSSEMPKPTGGMKDLFNHVVNSGVNPLTLINTFAPVVDQVNSNPPSGSSTSGGDDSDDESINGDQVNDIFKSLTSKLAPSGSAQENGADQAASDGSVIKGSMTAIVFATAVAASWILM